MARILEIGTKRKHLETARHQCEVCGSFIEYERHDVQRGVVQCPVCLDEVKAKALDWVTAP